MQRWWPAVLAALAAALAAPSPAADGDVAPKPLFASAEVIHLTIKGPFASANEGLRSSTPVAGSVGVVGPAAETLAVTLAPRGITRRSDDICPFGPLKVTFADKPAATSLFKGQKSLKLVTHCRGAASFQQYLLLEYAAYRMYNVLTPRSLAVRLASIDYVDAKGRPIATRMGFFIEDVGDLAKRNGLTELKTTMRVPSVRFEPADAARYALFQDMIGNLDWGMTAGPAGAECCHNSRLMAPAGAATGLVPVPYDYDFSGLVDAPYATPPATVKVPNVRVRRYRGFCRHNAAVPAAAALFRERQAALVGVLDAVPGLEDRSRHKAADYLAGFFRQIKDEGSTADLLKACLD